LCAFHRFVLDVTVERTVKSAERVLSVAVHPDGASQGGLPALPRFTGMHAQDCAPTAADGISPRPPFPWLSPKNVWFFTAANMAFISAVVFQKLTSAQTSTGPVKVDRNSKIIAM
jgi:hypothetical protein